MAGRSRRVASPVIGLEERMDDFTASEVHSTTPTERREAGIRLTGSEIFDSKSPAEQDAMLGPKAAEAVRAGDVSLDELVQRSPLDSDQPDYITQKPLPQEGD
jgi:hypothetical protein